MTKSDLDMDKHGQRRVQTSVERIKLQKSATQLSLNTQSLYQAQKRYPRSLYTNKNLTEALKLKPFEVGGVYYIQNNESSYIYPTETLFKSATNGLDDGKRRVSLCDDDSTTIIDQDDPSTIRPFSYLRRLPTALYRNDDANTNIQVKRKRKTQYLTKYDSKSESESPSIPWLDDGSSPLEIDKVKPLKDVYKTETSSVSDLPVTIKQENSELSSNADSDNHTSFIIANEPSSETIGHAGSQSKNYDMAYSDKSGSLENNRMERSGSSINVPLVTMQIKKDLSDEPGPSSTNLAKYESKDKFTKIVSIKKNEHNEQKHIQKQQERIQQRHEQKNQPQINQRQQHQDQNKEFQQKIQQHIEQNKQIKHINKHLEVQTRQKVGLEHEKIENKKATHKNEEDQSSLIVSFEDAHMSDIIQSKNNQKNDQNDKKIVEKLPKSKIRTILDSESTQTLISSTNSIKARIQKDKLDRKAIEKRLLEKYPFMFAIIYSEILVISSIVKIALQIVLMFHTAPYNYIPCGLISGTIGFLIFALVINTTLKRGYYSYKISQLCIILGVGVFVACAIINSICLSVYQSCASPCLLTFSMLYVNIILMIAEVLTLILSIFFLLDNLYEVESNFSSKSLRRKDTITTTSATTTTPITSGLLSR